jgi:activator of HSP90 ATPase
MTKPIVQSVIFKAPPEKLFALFANPKLHSAATRANATVSAKPGAKWTAFDGMLKGRNILVVPGKMIVQAWRASHWPKTDPDSILILTFSKVPGGGKVDMVHANVPLHDHKGVTKGWPHYYWNSWKAYLKEQSAKG